MGKVVFAIDTNRTGGAERVISILANWFSFHGQEVTVVNADSDSDFYKLNSSIKVIKLNLLGYDKCTKFVRKILFFIRFFKKESPDAAIAFLEAMEVPAIIAGFLTHTKVITSIRNADIDTSRGIRLFRKLFYPHIHGVVFQSNAVRNKKEYNRVKNAFVIYNPLSRESYADEPPAAYPDRKKWIVNAGRFVDEKNQALLIDAFSIFREKHSEYELHIFGEGNLEEDLKKKIQNLELENYIFLDNVQKNILKRQRKSMLYVCTSRSEGFPNVIAEAMANGIPVISTDFRPGTVTELIKDKKNGFLANSHSPQAVAEKMEEAVEMLEKTDCIVKEAVKIRKLLDEDDICRQWLSVTSL